LFLPSSDLGGSISILVQQRFEILSSWLYVDEDDRRDIRKRLSADFGILQLGRAGLMNLFNPDPAAEFSFASLVVWVCEAAGNTLS
jgi:hypothetical protein